MEIVDMVEMRADKVHVTCNNGWLGLVTISRWRCEVDGY